MTAKIMTRNVPLSVPSFIIVSLILQAVLLIFTTSAIAQTGWIELSDSDGEPTHRSENAYVKSGDKFYLLGGRGDLPVEIYDPENDRWTTGATPPIPLHHFQAVAYDDKVYVIGAFTGGFPRETPVSNIYIYHTDTDRWVKGPKIPEDRRRGSTGTVVYQDKIYIMGGIQNGHTDGHVRWFDSFDPETNEWEQLPDIPRYRDHFHAAVIDDILYLAGGRRSSYATGQVFDLTMPEVDVYDFRTGSWDILPPSGDLPTERAGTTTVATNKFLIVIGGESMAQEDAHSEVEAYNPVTGEWIELPSLNTGRHGVQAILHNGKIYIAAGSQYRGAGAVNSQEKLMLPDSLMSP